MGRAPVIALLDSSSPLYFCELLLAWVAALCVSALTRRGLSHASFCWSNSLRVDLCLPFTPLQGCCHGAGWRIAPRALVVALKQQTLMLSHWWHLCALWRPPLGPS